MKTLTLYKTNGDVFTVYPHILAHNTENGLLAFRFEQRPAIEQPLKRSLPICRLFSTTIPCKPVVTATHAFPGSRSGPRSRCGFICPASDRTSPHGRNKKLSPSPENFATSRLTCL